VDAETIVGIIPDLKHKKGFLKYEGCSVIVTDRRLIVARMTKQMRKALASTSAEEKYRGMAMDAILAETQGNFAIDASGVKRLRVERGAGGDIDTSGGPDRLIIKSTTGKHVFTFGTKSISAKEARALLKEAFGEVVK